jgi:hypothetical protein
MPILNTKIIKNNVKTMYAYSELSNKSKRDLRRALSDGNPCIAEIFEKIIVDDTTMDHYTTAFSFVTQEVFLGWLVNIEGPREFNDAIISHLEGIELLKDLDNGQMAFLQRLMYQLGLIICKHALAPPPTPTPTPTPTAGNRGAKRRIIRSPPPRRRR